MVDRAVKAAWVQTLSGGAFWPLDPRPEDVDLQCIAASLSNNGRYNGHCRTFYSVAQHAVHVSLLCETEAKADGQDRERQLLTAFCGLHHDDPEACGLPDVLSPIKDEFTIGDLTFREAEDKILRAIGQALGFPVPFPDGIGGVVHHFDRVAAATEKRDLMAPEPMPWRDLPLPSDERIVPLPPNEAEKLYLHRHLKLAAQLGQLRREKEAAS